MAEKPETNKLILFSGMGFELIALILVAIGAGSYLDTHWNARGLATAGAILLALAFWLWHILVLLKKTEKQD